MTTGGRSGQRRPDLEREYLDVYHPINEGIPRLRQLPDGHLVPIQDLYTAEELHTSRVYNEALRRGQYQQGVNVLLAGPGGDRMTWSLADPVASEGRCCMNRHWPARCPPTECLPADTRRRWSAKGGHPIQDLTAEDDLTPLPGWAPGAKTSSDDGRVAEERVLHSALTMVP